MSKIKNILPYNDNYNDISNPKYLYNNAEKITDVLKILSQLFFEKYSNNFSEEENTLFIMNFSGSINDFKTMLFCSEYSNNNSNALQLLLLQVLIDINIIEFDTILDGRISHLSLIVIFIPKNIEIFV
ncbi:hypothetical protein LY90DRAFT_516939 [Neocallimastix californiae]|uniref:Uncharacterized protein n=1 Tax=Neocallimastix californiae TaxID=1754190 RepID=A0A1Y2ACF8_9FUNG|nr:hypothetical protein LY90DRAFT_516939 [Neocallimastix californiae]|eukprot:ORY20259.1 hypothetical protein LY90DRAFT_516939 [Neocallimastix californiae]